MTLKNHKGVVGPGRVHVPYDWVYADTTAREAASGFVATDVGKYARQLDNNSIWMLTATTPVWGKTIALATTSIDGLLSAADKIKIDAFSQGSVTLTVRNESGSEIVKAKLVAVVGNNTHPLINLADKDSAALRPAIGVTTAAIPNNSNGTALVAGEITNIDTSAWALTDQLILGNTGNFSRPPPDQDPFTGEVQNVGSVVKVDATTGKVKICITGLNVVTGPQVFALQGTEGTPGPANKYVTDADTRLVWGSQFQQVSSETESSTTATTYQEKLKLTTPSIPAGTYRIGMGVAVTTSDADKGMSIRVQEDDTTTLAEITSDFSGIYANGVWYCMSGFKYVTLSSGVHFFDIDFKSLTAAKTAYTKCARLEFWRVS